MKTTAIITDNRLPEIAAMVPADTKIVIAKITKAAETRWKENIVEMDAVDTGAYLNSVQGESQNFEGEVASGVAYDVWVEFGTRRMSARPAMTQAAEAIRPVFEAAMTELVRRAGA